LERWTLPNRGIESMDRYIPKPTVVGALFSYWKGAQLAKWYLSGQLKPAVCARFITA
jgi:hypothetical protein